jgi:HK97 gp10 family phage protein
MAAFEGLEDLQQTLIAVALRFREVALKKAAMAGGQLIRDEAAERAPRRTGVLAEEEMISSARSSSTKFQATVHIGPSARAFYGEFVEKGTIYMRAEPFLRPALEAKREEAAQVAADVLALEFDQFMKS